MHDSKSVKNSPKSKKGGAPVEHADVHQLYQELFLTDLK